MPYFVILFSLTSSVLSLYLFVLFYSVIFYLDTSVERPLDMLPAEEVEEEIEDAERGVPQNASAEQEPDDMDKPENDKVRLL